ncbi:MAG TPA: hypothetical protein VMZ04_09660, partial [Anaerolineae bacterium]|nr:hypothetical protein [Anaerolineae bacterium]
YLKQPDSFILKEHFSVKTFTQKRIVNAIVPVVNIGPSFIGSRFGLNVVDVGAEVYVSDLLGQDGFIVGGTVGRNLKEDVPLNSRFEVYYQRKMVPITSSTYDHSPTLFGGVSRWILNNYIGRFTGEADTVYFADRLGYQNVLNDLHQALDIADIYRHEFRFYNFGIQIPLAPRHSLIFTTSFRQYYETLNRREEVKDFSTFVYQGKDITNEFSGAGETNIYDTRFFTDLEYFQSGEFSIDYNYYKIEPTADSDIAPKGTAALLRYRRMQSVIADSLVDQPLLQIPIGLLQGGAFYIVAYNPDPLRDELRAFNQKLYVNEYTLFFQRFQELPFFRHTFDGTLLIGYKDLSLKDVWKNEGSGYNWPLKYYLGGASILSGYPYFSFWGSKMFYSRFDYVFPIRQKIYKNLLGLQFQRLYGSVFFEAGRTWNFRRLSIDRLREGSFKRDLGFELRLKMVSFYRFPAFFTARVVWPLDGMGDSPYSDQRDARRFYFGLSI